jgi:hypothetical protein
VRAQALFGHVHAYARHWPTFDERVMASGAGAYDDPPATVHFTTGAAGNPEMRTGATPPPMGTCGCVRAACLCVQHCMFGV